MKRAFSFVELVISIIILAFIFSSISLFYTQVDKNNTTLKFFERLYALEARLLMHSNDREIFVANDMLKPLRLKETIVKDEIFELKKIEPFDKAYRQYFYNEKSF
ncbi:type II secretion system protein [Campylobacter vulpis]|uniref:Type II secretion system protein n=1 Tax=Campylobacter vulpis TaxID=1655500 RepID=A0ABS5P479_9BACT|nr:type II secretion system protein [Campylobacter vulpis]MBS4241483.1 type II secretion system protein [Campylobacter vulpis]MBS4253078.1 type II secretion system protein [Campylobacter vulpis]MBS4282332.1 type II secretion system protein [Campylobacter vulpis]MBS4314321.1 type II secretion system protein [Campylobacter vulpis]MBS4407686.1 type II secretion system protein [Campylobacter vulpis]